MPTLPVWVTQKAFIRHQANTSEELPLPAREVATSVEQLITGKHVILTLLLGAFSCEQTLKPTQGKTST